MDGLGCGSTTLVWAEMGCGWLVQLDVGWGLYGCWIGLDGFGWVLGSKGASAVGDWAMDGSACELMGSMVSPSGEWGRCVVQW